ncbi:MAG: FtsX-like permease family protein [Saprospiraceae bacterium]|nr:FtsX-like permease family protein [Saprospiraceae bacterium]
MNLSTARSSLRAKEVGLRKTVGAERSQLILQFLSESTLLAFSSLGVGLVICMLALPAFNAVADTDFKILDLFAPLNIGAMVLISLLVGVAAGSYPAFVMSSVRPINVLAGRVIEGMKGVSLRRVLVTFQFAISIFLLVVTIVVFKQLDYCQNIDLGYDKEQVIVFGTPLSLRTRYQEFRNELLSSPQVINAAGSSRVPPGSLSSSLKARPEGVPEDQQRGMQTVWTDYDFIETLGLEMAAGRSFSRDFPADANEGFIINEAAAKAIGWSNEEAIGKTFGSMEIRDWSAGQWEERNGKVVGVLKDFHFESLKNEIVPTVYFIAPYMAWNYLVRVRPDDIKETIAHIEAKWLQFQPDSEFEYTFIDERFARLYESESRQGRIFAIFAALAIAIACLGLIGLASFNAERKRKEIGIRKVLGANGLQLAGLLTREFTYMVLLAFCVAAPLGWYIMSGWLGDFVYRIPLSIFIFLLAGAAALLTAWLTVGYQTVRAIGQNPIEAVRSD